MNAPSAKPAKCNLYNPPVFTSKRCDVEALTLDLVGLILGVALLLLGGKSELFGAVAGFVIGLFVVQQFLGLGVLTLVVAGGAAIVGSVLLGVTDRGIRWLVRLIGAFAGAVVVLWAAQSLLVLTGPVALAVSLAVAVLIYVWLDRAYRHKQIVLSALLGAGLLVHSLGGLVSVVSSWVSVLLTLALAVIGYQYQRRRQ